MNPGFPIVSPALVIVAGENMFSSLLQDLLGTPHPRDCTSLLVDDRGLALHGLTEHHGPSRRESGRDSATARGSDYPLSTVRIRLHSAGPTSLRVTWSKNAIA